MESSRLDDRRKALHRHTIAMARQPPIDVVFESPTRAHALLTPDVVERNAYRIDDDRAGVSEIVHGLHEHAHDFGIGRGALVRLAEDADTLALQAVLPERCDEVRDIRWPPRRTEVARHRRAGQRH